MYIYKTFNFITYKKVMLIVPTDILHVFIYINLLI